MTDQRRRRLTEHLEVFGIHRLLAARAKPFLDVRLVVASDTKHVLLKSNRWRKPDGSGDHPCACTEDSAGCVQASVAQGDKRSHVAGQVFATRLAGSSKIDDRLAIHHTQASLVGVAVAHQLHSRTVSETRSA